MKHDWEYKKLVDVCGVQYGYAFDSTLFNEDKDGLPLVRIRDVVRGFSETYFRGAFSNDYVVRYGDYLVGMDGEFNIAQWKSEDALLNQRVCKVFAIDTKQAEMRFLYYFLTRQLKEIEDETPFVTVKHLSAKRINQIVAPIPPLPIQEQIVSELDKVSEIIEKKKQQVKELDNLAQSIFYDMFGDPVENEKGWDVKVMGDIGNFQRGSGLSKKVLVVDGYPCILYGQIHTRFGTFTKKHLSCIPNELVHTAKIAHPNDLIIAITSEDVEGSCKSTAWLGNYDIAVGSDAAIFSHNQNSIYVSYYTKTKAFYNEKAKYARGFKVTHISTKEIATISIMLPPLPLQQSFAQKIEAIEKQKELINQSIKEAQTLFDARMDYWFGE